MGALEAAILAADRKGRLEDIYLPPSSRSVLPRAEDRQKRRGWSRWRICCWQQPENDPGRTFEGQERRCAAVTFSRNSLRELTRNTFQIKGTFSSSNRGILRPTTDEGLPG